MSDAEASGIGDNANDCSQMSATEFCGTGDFPPTVHYTTPVSSADLDGLPEDFPTPVLNVLPVNSEEMNSFLPEEAGGAPTVHYNTPRDSSLQLVYPAAELDSFLLEEAGGGPTPSTSQAQSHSPSSEIPSTSHTPCHNSQFQILEDLRVGDMIGQGSFGSCVYKGERLSPDDRTTKCAVKIINLDLLNARQYKLVEREMENMKDLKHPKLMSVDRCVISQMTCVIISELQENMSCEHILRTLYPHGLPEQAIGLIVKDVLSALTYLHSKAFIHRGIKASHILISKNGEAKLTGFRFMEKLPHGQATITESNALGDMTSYLNWLAPEILQQDKSGFGFKSDVYSIGITILELGNGVVPHSDISPPGILVRAMHESAPRLWERCNLPSQESGGNPQTEKEVNLKDEPYLSKKYSKDIKIFLPMCVAASPESRASLGALCKTKFYSHYAKQESSSLINVLKRLSTPVKYECNLDKCSSAKYTSCPDWDF